LERFRCEFSQSFFCLLSRLLASNIPPFYALKLKEFRVRFR